MLLAWLRMTTPDACGLKGWEASEETDVEVADEDIQLDDDGQITLF